MECNKFVFEEYFKIVDLIDSFDVRLLTIKGWSITFSLVMIGLAFEKNRGLLLLLAAISSFSFFLIDATYKNYQTNYYSRMNQIEVTCSKQADEKEKIKDKEELFPTPGINWAWWKADEGKKLGEAIGTIKFDEPKTIWDAFGSLGTYLPHAFPFIFGILFYFIYPRICEHGKEQANKSLYSSPKSSAS